MNSIIRIACVTAILIIIGLYNPSTAQAARVRLIEEKLSYESFGELTTYRVGRRTSSVGIILSDENGWTETQSRVARALARRRTLVIGVDLHTYLQNIGAISKQCLDVATDLDHLSHFVQEQYSRREYIKPVLVGYDTGGSLVYAVLSQAHAELFRGGLSIGFCQTVQCAQKFTFQPSAKLSAKWVLLNLTNDPTYSPRCLNEKVLSQFTTSGDDARLVTPRSSHHAVSSAFYSLVFTGQPAPLPQEHELKDLPLIETSVEKTNSPLHDTMAIIITGDGGWAGIDSALAKHFTANGLAVVGLDALQYFWVRKSPAQAATDLGRIIRHYTREWHKKNVVLVGYSRGADVLPFMIRRLDNGSAGYIRRVALLGPIEVTDFEFHVDDWAGGLFQHTEYDVLPEIQQTDLSKVICFYGTKEKDSVCSHLQNTLATVVLLQGSHHFDENYDAIADRIISSLANF